VPRADHAVWPEDHPGVAAWAGTAPPRRRGRSVEPLSPAPRRRPPPGDGTSASGKPRVEPARGAARASDAGRRAVCAYDPPPRGRGREQARRGPYRPWYEVAAAVRAGAAEPFADARLAEGALEGTDPRIRSVRRQILVAALAVRPQLQHGPNLRPDARPWCGRQRPLRIRPLRPARPTSARPRRRPPGAGARRPAQEQAAPGGPP
jgi:hypothetical protein